MALYILYGIIICLELMYTPYNHTITLFHVTEAWNKTGFTLGTPELKM
jgi:hypothetical protein